MKKTLLFIIKAYQKILSPDHGWLAHRYPYGFCRFAPSCSDYAHSAITYYGTVKGVELVLRRLMRCHPFGPPAYDPLIRRQTKTNP